MDVAAGRFEVRARLRAVHELADQLEVDGKCDQVLLDAVVERALDPSAFAVRGGCDARSRGSELLDLSAQTLD